MKTNQDLDIKNPAHNSKLQREKVDNDRERYLDLDEIEKLWKSIEERKGDEAVTYRLKLFVALSLSTGARLRSVMTISKADINLQQDTIIIKNHKSNRTYTGFLHQNWKELIENRMKDLRPIDYIVSGTPQEIVRSVIGRNLQPLLEQFNKGIDEADTKRRVVIHSLRHTFASLLAIQGTPIYTIMRLMDHKDMTQTTRYSKLSPDSVKDSVNQLKFK
jgi:integrase